MRFLTAKLNRKIFKFTRWVSCDGDGGVDGYRNNFIIWKTRMETTVQRYHQI